MKNKKGQTAIDITNSKTIIRAFWNYLTKSEPEDNKELGKACPLLKAGKSSNPKINIPYTKDRSKPYLSTKAVKHKEYNEAQSGTVSFIK